MKKAIFTLAIGDNPMYRAAVDSFKEYGKKIGADVIVSDQLHYKININNPKFDASPAWSEKLYIQEILKEYDRVLYLDADIIVTPEARDIFELYPDLDTVYMFNEGFHRDRSQQAQQINTVLGEVDWPKENNQVVYYNSGMFLISKETGLFDNANIEEMQAICNEVKFYDQTYINYLIRRDNINSVGVEANFNRMQLLGHDNYQDADFIHYSGRGYRQKVPMRELKYIIDYCKLYSGTLSEAEVLKFKQESWNWYILKQNRKTKLPRSLLSFIFGLFHPSHKY
ncbi:Glycosyl transferase family 8 [Shewanella psychrophila]|uniref:Glycosyl transferase family 8 n=1 Tax=Shewanella psychrophila TaxID=225848 RepID=A0A1S6HIM8_9GAMM|nr:glycosyltransferase [Shewanella psychrophila]AQS35376.1 Glycosyl transferase family 8 [Shewanella psychrophila]